MYRLTGTMRSFLSVLLLILISSCASMEIKLVEPALSGDEIKKLIVGNTLQGPLGRELYDWYYRADGQVTGVVGGTDDDSGTWQIKDKNVYCHEWDQYFDGVQRCYQWYKEEAREGRYMLKNVDADRSGNIEVWIIRPGNPFKM
jgi:hypothetical protein